MTEEEFDKEEKRAADLKRQKISDTVDFIWSLKDKNPNITEANKNQIYRYATLTVMANDLCDEMTRTLNLERIEIITKVYEKIEKQAGVLYKQLGFDSIKNEFSNNPFLKLMREDAESEDDDE